MVGAGNGDAYCNVLRLDAPASAASRDASLRALAASRAARLRREAPGATTGPVELEHQEGRARATFIERDRLLGRQAAGRITLLPGAERILGVECRGPPAQFAMLDARVFRPLTRSVRPESR